MKEAQTENGRSSELEETDEEHVVGPNPAFRPRSKRPFQFERAYLDSLPCANMYEKSYMHRDVVTHVAVSAADFFITGSADGVLKFWKKIAVGIEFVKHFRSHLGAIEGLAVSMDGMLCCTISSDHSVKLYDVVNYEMMVMIRLPFVPGAIEWVYKQGEVKAKLAISDRNSSFVHIYDARAGSNEPIISKEIHLGPAKVMKYNHVFDTVISTDAKGIIEYWNPDTLQFPDKGLSFRLKSDTNLLEIVKWKTTVSAIEVSPDGKQFSITSYDRRIHVFWFRTGKLRRVYDESVEVALDLQWSDVPLYQLEPIDFGRRMVVEKEFEKTENASQPNAVFDESSKFLIYATLLGIKVINLHTNKVSRILGKAENNDRFLRIALYQGDRSSKKVRKIPAAAANANESKEPLADPTLLCCAFKKHRIYVFSRREPEEPECAAKGRDVLNEKPPADELVALLDLGKAVTTSFPDNVTTSDNDDMVDEHGYWPRKVEYHFIQLLYEEAKKGLQISTLNEKAWNAMEEILWSTYGKRYSVSKLKAKHSRLRRKHREFEKLLEFPGMDWDPDKNIVHASEDVWVNYLKKNSFWRHFKPKGCEHYYILGEIFKGTTATGQMALASSQSPPDSLEERELVSEFLRSGAHIDVDKQFVYEALDEGEMVLKSTKEGNATKLRVVGPLHDRCVEKESRSSKTDFALEAWSKSLSSKTEISLARAEKIKNPEGVSSENLDPYSIDECMKVLESVEDVDDDAYGKACERFTSPDWRRMFMQMSDGRKKAWVRNLK